MTLSQLSILEFVEPPVGVFIDNQNLENDNNVGGMFQTEYIVSTSFNLDKNLMQPLLKITRKY